MSKVADFSTSMGLRTKLSEIHRPREPLAAQKTPQSSFKTDMPTNPAQERPCGDSQFYRQPNACK